MRERVRATYVGGLTGAKLFGRHFGFATCVSRLCGPAGFLQGWTKRSAKSTNVTPNLTPKTSQIWPNLLPKTPKPAPKPAQNLRPKTPPTSDKNAPNLRPKLRHKIYGQHLLNDTPTKITHVGANCQPHTFCPTYFWRRFGGRFGGDFWILGGRFGRHF